ncbi:hypothetical protein [Pseudotabrizicola sp. 4114]|uniref:hypothetical protein n=1 Tax=Pseudotabrizicola sp. 4114 TaxID=2817731 RepID=UPI0028648622|nr:enamine deaminase RidA (YjgF/YER057c/UK114 family) [Pseudorhodobacter sp. 4114]
MTAQILHPEAWKPARGCADGMAAQGRRVRTGGLIGRNAGCEFETDGFVGQIEPTLHTIVTVLAKTGGRPGHPGRLIEVTAVIPD